MPERGRRFDYIIRRHTRDARGHFTQLQHAEALSQYRRKHAEWHARERSRQHLSDLVTLVRDGVILSHFLNGLAVSPDSRRR